MQTIQIQRNINYMFETAISKKKYENFEGIFETIATTFSLLTKQQSTDLANYIKCMSPEVLDKISGNAKLLSHIQKVIKRVGPRFCSNITIETSEVHFFAHEAMLVAHSEYVRVMLSGKFQKECPFSGVPAEILEKIIQYTNTGFIDLFDEDIGKVFLYADMYVFTKLKKEIENHLISSVLKGENRLDLWDIAKKSNTKKLLSAIIYREFKKQGPGDSELRNKIYNYFTEKGIKDGEELCAWFQSLDKLDLCDKLDYCNGTLSWSFRSTIDFPFLSQTLLDLMGIDALCIDLDNKSISDPNKLLEIFKVCDLPLSLSLYCCSITDEFVTELSRIIIDHDLNIVNLSLDNNRISKVGATALARVLEQNKTLQKLEMRCNTIGEEGTEVLAQALKKNSYLQYLDLLDNDIGEKGAKALAQALEENKSLQTLHLNFNNLRNGGAQALAQALKKNKSLRSLELLNNYIRDEGVKDLAHVFKGSTSLQLIDLRCNGVEVDVAQALARDLQENSVLPTDVMAPGWLPYFELDSKNRKFFL